MWIINCTCELCMYEFIIFHNISEILWYQCLLLDDRVVAFNHFGYLFMLTALSLLGTLHSLPNCLILFGHLSFIPFCLCSNFKLGCF